MTIWQPKSGQLTRPIYLSLQKQFIAAIDSGELAPGEQLPTHRDLAYTLDVSVQTISRAYEALRDLGYITGEIGRGSFVCARSGDIPMPFLPDREEELIDLSLLKPAIDDTHTKAMKEALHGLGRRVEANLIRAFRPEAAVRPQVEVLSNWLCDKGIPTRSDVLVPTNGAASALTTALMTAVPPGAAVVSEEISFHTLKPLCRYLGLRLYAASADAQGLTPDAFEQACLKHHPRAVFLMPSAAGPKAGLMDEQRRKSLLAIAENHSVFIIEDDVLGTMIEDAPATFYARAPELTFYLSSFSKTIIPGLRFGFLLTPEASIVAARNRHMVTNWMATPLMADIAAQWLADGTADRLIAWQRRELTVRQAIVREIIGHCDYCSHTCGMHIWLHLPVSWSETEFMLQLRRQNIAVAGSLPFVMGDRNSEGEPRADNAVRIAIGATSQANLRRALISIRDLLDGHSEKLLPAF